MPVLQLQHPAGVADDGLYLAPVANDAGIAGDYVKVRFAEGGDGLGVELPKSLP